MLEFKTVLGTLQGNTIIQEDSISIEAIPYANRSYEWQDLYGFWRLKKETLPFWIICEYIQFEKVI